MATLDKKPATAADLPQPIDAESVPLPGDPPPPPAPAPGPDLDAPGDQPPPPPEKKEPVLSSSDALNASLFDAPRRRGRPRKDQGAPGAAPEPISQSQKKSLTDSKEARKALCRSSGETTARILLGMLATQGPGFRLDPTKENEKIAYEMALVSTGEMFAHYDLGDMPPAVACAVAWGQIAFIFANKPENAERVKTLKDRMMLWLAERKIKAATKKEG